MTDKSRTVWQTKVGPYDRQKYDSMTEKSRTVMSLTDADLVWLKRTPKKWTTGNDKNNWPVSLFEKNLQKAY
jgi:hypothetical protein